MGPDLTEADAVAATRVRQSLCRRQWFKTCVVRMTDHAADNIPGFARNDYSRRQAFNADSSKIIVSAKDGSWWDYDVKTRRPLGKLEGLALAARAAMASRPLRTATTSLFTFGLGMQLKRAQRRHRRKSRVAVPRPPRITAIWPHAKAAWTRNEIAVERRGAIGAFRSPTASGTASAMLVYDMTADQIVGSYDFAENHHGRPDHVTMSPTGNYLAATFDRRRLRLFARLRARSTQAASQERSLRHRALRRR